MYRAIIPPQANDALVSYFIEAYLGGVYSASPDSSIPNFYVIKDAGLTIYDVQHTPYSNGLSGFAYDTVTVSGVVTADSSDIKDLYTRGGRTNVPLIWLQGGGSTWNGIQIWGVPADTLKRGDSITVRGTVYGTSNRTQLQALTVTLLKRDATIPAPIVQLMTSPSYWDYDISNPPTAGTAKFQQYMSMLVELDNMYIIYRNADNLSNGNTSNYGEFFVSNVTTPPYGLRINDNGVNHYFADTNSAYITAYNSSHPFTAGIKTTLIPYLTKVSYIRGILDYTNSNFKMEPRKDDDFGTMTPPTSVEKEENVLPSGFSLSQNYPNPFNPSTTIRYVLPQKSKVTLKIFNLLGQVVESLINTEQGAGSYVVQYNASRLATGVYFYELRANEYRDIKKMLLLK